MKKKDLESVLLQSNVIEGSGIVWDVQIKVKSNEKKAYFEPITNVPATQIHNQLGRCLHDSRHNLKIKPCSGSKFDFTLSCNCGLWMNIAKANKKLTKVTCEEKFNRL